MKHSLIYLVVFFLIGCGPQVSIEKPQKQTSVAIDLEDHTNSYLQFYATQEIAAQMEDYGLLLQIGHDLYGLTLDRRYDFQEVKTYLLQFK